MSRFHVRYAQAYLTLLALGAGGAAGLHLSRWLAGGGVPSPGSRAEMPLSVTFPRTPDAAVTTTWIRLFDAARRDIWLSAGRLESEGVLRALDAASRRGVAVHLTLSPSQNPSPDSGARGWLRDKTSLRDVRIAPWSFDGAACAIDDTYAVVTGQGLLPVSGASADAGIFLYSAGPQMARPLRARLRAQHDEAQPESPP